MRKRFWRPLSYQQRLRLLLLPYLSGILLLVVLPALLSFSLAFFRYDALSPPTWVGNLNFLLASTDELFLLSIQNSLALVISPVPLRVFGAFLLAVLLRRNGRFHKVVSSGRLPAQRHSRRLRPRMAVDTHRTRLDGQQPLFCPHVLPRLPPHPSRYL